MTKTDCDLMAIRGMIAMAVDRTGVRIGRVNVEVKPADKSSVYVASWANLDSGKQQGLTYFTEIFDGINVIAEVVAISSYLKSDQGA